MWKIASPDPVQTGIKVQGLIRLWTLPNPRSVQNLDKVRTSRLIPVQPPIGNTHQVVLNWLTFSYAGLHMRIKVNT